jgi:hypothetical protein
MISAPVAGGTTGAVRRNGDRTAVPIPETCSETVLPITVTVSEI